MKYLHFLMALLAFSLGCAGLFSAGDDVGTLNRREIARRMAVVEPFSGVAPLLSPYESGLGEVGVAVPMTVKRERTRMVSVTVHGRVGPVPFTHASYHYGRMKATLLPSDLEALDDAVLKEVAVGVRGEQCEELRAWLEETYGPPLAGAWDGVRAVLTFRWQPTGGSGKACMVWWTYWPPDEQPHAIFRGKAPGSPILPRIDDANRAAYQRIWDDAVPRVLLGAAAPSDIDTEGLDAPHAATLRQQLQALIVD